MIFLLLIGLILIQWHIGLDEAAFTIIPSSQVVGIGQQAVFRCQNPNANVVGWMWNNSAVTESNRPPGVTLDRVLDENRNVVEYTLTIVAQSNYNETEVVCVAVIFGMPDQETAPVSLKIQGPITMVMDINRTSSIITWEPPFSINLTGVDPDIVYCVEVDNITCGMDDLVVSDCNVTKPRFIDNTIQQGYIYRITITPRSNGLNALNGTSNTKEEIFTSITDPKIIIMLAKGSTTECASIQLKYEINDGKIEPDSYSLSLSPIDGVEILPKRVILTSLIHSTDTVILNVTQPLPCRRLWNYQILALGCSEHSVSNSLELSTHDFQSVSVSSLTPGEVSVTGKFVNGSTASAVLVIVYSGSCSDVYYLFSSPSSEKKQVASVRGLPSGLYNVSVFVVEESGLPFNRSAATPKSVLIMEGECDYDFQIEHEVQSMSTGVCINCTFLDSSATDCVVVVHQRISQLSSSGLMNIESSHKFNRYGNTAYGCIEGVNLEYYQVGVIGLRTSIIPSTTKINTESECKWCIQVGAFAAGVVLGVILTSLTVMIIIRVTKKRAELSTSTHGNTNQGEHIKLQKCDAYEISKPLGQHQHRDLAVDDNPAYGVHQDSNTH